MDERLFTPDDKIAPGIYMRYWEDIVSGYGIDSLEINKLKAYREVRNGAILAALWTKATGEKHFVSFPHEEPADVEIYSLVSKDFNGKPSYDICRVPVQLTRCLLSRGETILGQIVKKNKPSLENTTLVVHIIGENNIVINLSDIIKRIHKIEKIYPREIAILAPIHDTSSVKQTFAQQLIYSRDDDRFRSSIRVNLDETDAFFAEPPIMRNKRGTGQTIKIAGKVILKLP